MPSLVRVATLIPYGLRPLGDNPDNPSLSQFTLPILAPTICLNYQ